MKKLVELHVATKPCGSSIRASSTPALLAWRGGRSAIKGSMIGINFRRNVTHCRGAGCKGAGLTERMLGRKSNCHKERALIRDGGTGRRYGFG